MDDGARPMGVQILQDFGHLNGVVYGHQHRQLGTGQGLLIHDLLLEVDPFDKFHHDDAPLAIEKGIYKGRNTGKAEVLEDLNLFFKALVVIGSTLIGPVRPGFDEHSLDGDHHVGLFVDRAVDLTHSTASDSPLDLVAVVKQCTG